MNLLSGKYKYKGKISAKVKFMYFPFYVDNKNESTYNVLLKICENVEEWKIIREFSYLKINEDVLYRSYNSLSSGEQTKMLLAGLFLNEENFLLIDEPTNHLDSEGRIIVSDYLKRKKSFIIVSHDRIFLDGCVDHILSLNKTNIEVQVGNFSSWFENFNKKQNSELAQNEKLKKDIYRLTESSKKISNWSNRAETEKYGIQSSGLKADRGYMGHKAAKMMKRAKVVESRQEKAIAQKSGLLRNIETADNLKLFPLDYRFERLIDVDEVEICYGERKIGGKINFELLKGDRIALEGKNGCGKSSLLKMIIGENVPHSGTLRVSSGLIISYVPQITDFLSGRLSDYAENRGIDESLFKAILSKMDFNKKDFERDLSLYSSGQKKKVLIAVSLCEKAHLYIWDEPLNFIDIYARMQIENLLKKFNPTMIFVEHDRTFQNAIATKIIRL